MNVPQRNLEPPFLRANRNFSNIEGAQGGSAIDGIALNTLHSSSNDQRHTLAADDDLDDEMHNHFEVNPPRTTDYEYAQTQENK